MKILNLILLLTAASLLRGQPQSVEFVVPIVNGNEEDWEPLAFDAVSLDTSRRYQQVYDSSAFSSVAPVGGIITGIAFQTATANLFLEDVPSLQVDLYYTGNGPDNLSPVFAENLTGSGLTVFDRKGIHLIGIVGGYYRGLGIPLPLDRTFFYDPRAGNLLMDIRLFEEPIRSDGYPFRSLDAHSLVGDTVSRVYGGPVDSPSGTVDSIGLVTWFTIEPIPEPSPLLLFVVLGSVALASSFFLKRNSAKP